MEVQLQKLNETSLENKDVKPKLENALQVIDRILEKGILNRKDVEILIEKIVVDNEGIPEIELRYGLSGLIKYDAIQEMNRQENEIIYNVLKIIMEEDREYTSRKYITKAIVDLGYHKNPKSMIPYINIMIELGILEPTEDHQKPYNIIKTKQEIKEILETYSWAVESKNMFNPDYRENLHYRAGDRRNASNGI